MSPIHKQVMTDDHGQPVSVVIPYHEWLEIERVLLNQPQGTESSRPERVNEFGTLAVGI